MNAPKILKLVLLQTILTLSYICNAQLIVDKSTQAGVNESPLGMVKSGNNLVVINGYNPNDYFYQVGATIVRAYDSNLNILYTDTLNIGARYLNPHFTGPTWLQPMFKVVEGPKKTVLFSMSGDFCYGTSFQTYGQNSSICLIDSMGQLIFNTSESRISYGADVVSPTFFYEARRSASSPAYDITRISPVTGASISTIYQTNNLIHSVQTNMWKQILFSSGNSITLIDTLGNVIINKPSTDNYVKLILKKHSGYIGITKARDKLVIHDSLLNKVDSLNLPTITDCSVKNDSIIVVGYNSSTKQSYVRLYSGNFSILLAQKNFSAEGQAVVAVNKGQDYYFLSNLSFDWNHRAASLSRFADLNSLTYPNNIMIRSVAIDSLSINTSTSQSISSCHYYAYTPNLKIVNLSSTETIGSFYLNHPILECYSPTSNCSANNGNNVFDTVFTNLNIPPLDSAVIQLKRFYVSKLQQTFSPSNVYLNFSVGLPNYKSEGSLANNVFTYSFSPSLVGLHEEEGSNELVLFPNPVQDQLQIKGLVGKYDYNIFNTSGFLVQSGSIKQPEISTSSLNSGLYLISFKNSKRVVLKKFLKE